MQQIKHTDNIHAFRLELNDELESILHYWIKNTIDWEYGGFKGRIDEENSSDIYAPKGSVLNARILWTFAAAYNFKKDSVYLDTATRAYHYISKFFIDEEFGGVYWSVDNYGTPFVTKKQAYAIAFTLYGLTEYYKCTKDVTVKEEAIRMFHILINKFYDAVYGGYFEAFSKNWEPIENIRLSEKDMPEKKTMNTHLHILEAYTNLYRIWPNGELYTQIVLLVNTFLEKIIDQKNGHLGLFFDEQWNEKSSLISFGHDIETSWLLLEAARVTKENDLISRVEGASLKLVEGVVEALDDDFGMWYEKNTGTNHWIKQKHWWVQAEAMIGFVNGWQMSQREEFLNLAMNNWNFIKKKIKDNKYGEWLWGVNDNGVKLAEQDKVGIWKCPYHNSRACIEILTRLEPFA